MFTLLVEGWRFYPQSLSIVNQFQCLELLKHPVRLFHTDVPPPPAGMLRIGHAWESNRRLLGDAQARALALIPDPDPGERPDSVYRIFFPHDFSEARHGRTFVFVVTEARGISPYRIGGNIPLRKALGPEVTIVTPSNWSRLGLVESGAAESRVAVVPHGVDTAIFHPVEETERAQLRRKLGWEESFVFLHVGAQYEWKGTGLALKAFAAMAATEPRARLALKGVDDIYASRASVARLEHGLTAAEQALIQSRLHYVGDTLSFAALANLYRAADVLLSPYLGEGFNLPALEAIACGLPVICTEGGPTDDFIRDDFALRIESRLVPTADKQGFWLYPDLDHLIALMRQVVGDDGLARRARKHGPEHVRAHYTWEHAVARLLEVLMERPAASVSP